MLKLYMATCINCGEESRYISKALRLCLKCIREDIEKVLPTIQKAHEESRRVFGLPARPPKNPDGVPCHICINECRIPEGGLSYCGLRTVKDGRLIGVNQDEGNLSWYHDPLPTNCVGDWVCAAGTGVGYPEYAYTNAPEYGYKNLAVFYQACSFNCLFCQNWHFKEMTFSKMKRAPSELAGAVDKWTSCICYFGGDPTPQLPHALKASRLALENNKERILRICWETNGSMHPSYLDRMMDLSIKSGGCVKFDLKTWDEGLNIALCGVTNKRTIENFRRASKRIKERPEPPPLIASTLLVPGYIDEEEVSMIARFIASLNPDIPYALLCYHPQFYMTDIPVTLRDQAYRCLNAARSEGLTRARLGNMHLLA